MSMHRTAYLDAGKCQLGCDLSVLAAGKAGLARRNLWPPETFSKSLPMRRKPCSVILCQCRFLAPTVIGWIASAAAMCGAGTFVYCTVSAHARRESRASRSIHLSCASCLVCMESLSLQWSAKSCARCSISTARTRPAIAWSLGSCRELVRSVDPTIFPDDEVGRWSIKGCPFESELQRVNTFHFLCSTQADRDRRRADRRPTHWLRRSPCDSKKDSSHCTDFELTMLWCMHSSEDLSLLKRLRPQRSRIATRKWVAFMGSY
jgi:hypothetical protein